MRPAPVAAIVLPPVRMVFAGRVQIKAAGPEALWCALLAPIRCHDRCAKPRLPARLGRRRPNRDGRGDQRPDPRQRHEPPGHLVLSRAPCDLGNELACRHLQTGERGDGIGGQTAARVLDDGDPSRGVGCRLRHDLAERAQMVAPRIDRPGPPPDGNIIKAPYKPGGKENSN